MHARCGRALVIGLALAVLAAPRAWAGPPTDQLSERIDQVLKVLGDQELKAPAKAAERSESVQLLADLIERSYVGRMDAYSGERVVFLGDTIDGELAVVKTRIVSKQSTELPVDYRMFRRGDRWRVYDVTIEGVSLVANYRSQFDRILQRSSFQQLVSQVKEKR